MTNPTATDPTATDPTATDPTAALGRLLREAQLAAYGDSNDREIDLLREALDSALGLLGIEWPELTDDEIAAAEGF